MKKLLIGFMLFSLAVCVFAQTKVVQKSSIGDVNIRWVYNEKTKSDYLELCRSPKFDEVVYRFVCEDNVAIEAVIPLLESASKVLANVELNTEYVKAKNLDSLYSFGTVYALFLSAADAEEAKKYYNLDWCSCLIVYKDFSVSDIEYDSIIDLLEDF